MLILPPGHAKATGIRRGVSSREKWMIWGVLAVTAALVVAVVIAFAAGGRTSARGCIYATVPAATGAEDISQCGATAASTCASLRTPGAFTPQAAGTVAAQCRKAGLRVGP